MNLYKSHSGEIYKAATAAAGILVQLTSSCHPPPALGQGDFPGQSWPSWLVDLSLCSCCGEIKEPFSVVSLKHRPSSLSLTTNYNIIITQIVIPCPNSKHNTEIQIWSCLSRGPWKDICEMDLLTCYNQGKTQHKPVQQHSS